MTNDQFHRLLEQLTTHQQGSILEMFSSLPSMPPSQLRDLVVQWHELLFNESKTLEADGFADKPVHPIPADFKGPYR